ncbi:MAG: LysM peptidoglycan-binding domain-containing protein [Actinomycetota bacterium]|nr:LysM peptidoglycan-binding domain-containing protein [Actinomycetota bacterium]
MSAATWEHSGAMVGHPSARGARPLHLTPRGRRVVTAFAVGLALVVGLVGGRAMASSPEQGIAVDVYTVSSGETLWSIASSLAAPGVDVRDAVEDLMSLNELESSAIAAGQQLIVPVAVD